MQAKITYTIEVKDIPKEVNRLLDLKLKNLKTLLKTDYTITSDTLNLSIEKIDHLRRVIFDVDNRLAECYSMLSGYRKSLEEKSKEEKEESFSNLQNEIEEIDKEVYTDPITEEVEDASEHAIPE